MSTVSSWHSTSDGVSHDTNSSITSTPTSTTIGCPTCNAFPVASTLTRITRRFGDSERRCAACGTNCGKPSLLDLFSGAGGAARGYQRAGFCVLGVDINPQPHFAGCQFHQGDAIEILQSGSPWAFDATHASPPCQEYSVTSSLHEASHPDLYVTTRHLLQDAGVPWVLENVIGAPYDWGVVLCGGMFDLRVRRHRNFEAPFLMTAPHHRCPPEPIDVTGVGGPGGRHRKPAGLADARDAMGIDWMTRKELSQAIPPAYTEFIGRQLIDFLKSSRLADTREGPDNE